MFVRFSAVWVLVAALAGAAQAAAGVAQTTTRYPMAALGSQCVEFTKVKQGSQPGDYRECRVSESGDIGRVNDQTFYYALYCLIPSEAAIGTTCASNGSAVPRALAVFSRGTDEPDAGLMFERADEEIGTVYYGRPEFVPADAGTILVLPIVLDGTSAGNESEYYLRGPGQWNRIESDAWHDDLLKRLPRGLEIWKGIWPDLTTMTAVVELYQASDANCCPTGGTARVHLAVRGGRFVIEALEIDAAR